VSIDAATSGSTARLFSGKPSCIVPKVTPLPAAIQYRKDYFSGTPCA
jgi:hypothetical protein